MWHWTRLKRYADFRRGKYWWLGQPSSNDRLAAFLRIWWRRLLFWRTHTTSVFVSYAHDDTWLVEPVVGLLRATQDYVFYDIDSLKPGQKWQAQIDEAINSVDLFVLFWCQHSRSSEEVAREIKVAISTDRNVLPVRLDETPLNEALSSYQWVDFQHIATKTHFEPPTGVSLGFGPDPLDHFGPEEDSAECDGDGFASPEIERYWIDRLRMLRAGLGNIDEEDPLLERIIEDQATYGWDDPLFLLALGLDHEMVKRKDRTKGGGR